MNSTPITPRQKLAIIPVNLREAFAEHVGQADKGTNQECFGEATITDGDCVTRLMAAIASGDYEQACLEFRENLIPTIENEMVTYYKAPIRNELENRLAYEDGPDGNETRELIVELDEAA